MLERFIGNWERLEVPPNAQVLVGYSGGADSTCLLDLCRRAGLKIVAAHLHHGQRAEADQEADQCQAFCESLDVPFVLGRSDVPKLARDHKVGLEEAGRMARYEFFAQAAFRFSCDFTATGHTQDDHLETLLLNMTRGSGLSGLAGIQPRTGDLLRPLLFASRDETRSYCQQHALWFHNDPGNDDPAFARVRARLSALPALLSLHPGARNSLLRLSDLASEEDRFLDGAAAAGLEHAEIERGPLGFLSEHEELFFHRRVLASLPPVLRRRALRLAVRALGGSLDADGSHQVADSMTSDSGGSWTAEGGSPVLEWQADILHVYRPGEPESFRHPLQIPGETTADVFGWKFETYEVANADFERKSGSLDVVIDRRATKGPLFFRTTEPGDAFVPLGAPGTRKAADMASEAGLSRIGRKKLPVVCDLAGIVWMPGVALAHRVRVTEATLNGLRLVFAPLNSEPAPANRS